MLKRKCQSVCRCPSEAGKLILESLYNSSLAT
nr:MAG TPA: hypothetical protein [Caudoviricetes sp.]